MSDMQVGPVGTDVSAEAVRAALVAAIEGCEVTVLENGSVSGQHSLVLGHEHAVEAAEFLRDDAELRLDFCSNMTGVDWPDQEVTEKIKVKKMVEGPEGPAEQEVEETRKTMVPGYLEAVYHLFSMEKKHGPVILRLRTRDRGEGNHVPSLTPVWRGVCALWPPSARGRGWRSARRATPRSRSHRTRGLESTKAPAPWWRWKRTSHCGG